MADRRTALSDELRVLARRYPRASWASHANLGGIARFWLERHEMFRRLDQMIRSGAEAALHARTEAADFKPWLGQHLHWLLNGLEEHHQVEDFHYLFRRAEPRLGGHRVARARSCGAAYRNRRHRPARQRGPHRGTDSARFRADLARFHDAHVEFGRDLLRHLDDEEDLVIPLLLERGEHAFTGG